MNKLQFNYLADDMLKPVIVVLGNSDKLLGTLEIAVDGFYYYNSPRNGYLSTTLAADELKQIGSELDKVNGSSLIRTIGATLRGLANELKPKEQAMA